MNGQTVTYDAFRFYLQDGRIGTVWATSADDLIEQMNRLLDEHRAKWGDLASAPARAGFRNADERPAPRLRSF